MIEIIGGQWAAGETKTFHINGEYIEILDAQYPCDVLLMDRTGAQLSVMKSSEASFFARPREGFNTVQITSAQAQVIRVFVGSGDAGTRRISSTVQVVDGERARTNAGVMFGACVSPVPVAAQYARAQLWNPAASGKRLIVSRVVFGNAGVSQVLGLSAVTAAEATNVTATQAANKLLGSAGPSAEVRHGNNAALLNFFFAASFAAAAILDWKASGVIVVPPGYGLVVSGSVVNTNQTANFEWFEEAI